MLTLELRSIAKAKGITKLSSYLRSLGFSPSLAKRWARGQVEIIDLADLQTICHAFRCEPHDVLKYTPDPNRVADPNDPLAALIKPDEAPDIGALLRALPLKEAQALARDLAARKGP